GRPDHLADAVVEHVGEEQVAGRVQRHAGGVVDRGGGGRAIVSAVRPEAVGRGGDDSAGCLDHLAEPVVERIGEEQVARRVHRHFVGVVERGGGGRATIAAETRGAVARDGDDVAGGLDHLADAVVAGVGEEQVARRVQRHARGVVDRGGGGRAIVSAV